MKGSEGVVGMERWCGWLHLRVEAVVETEAGATLHKAHQYKHQITVLLVRAGCRPPFDGRMPMLMAERNEGR